MSESISNKYSMWYYHIIKNRKLNPVTEGYTEKHHIIPRSLGGGESKENIICLTAREHFICHLLLTKMFPNDKNKTAKMIKAWCWMAWDSKEGRDYPVNSRLFESFRKKNSTSMSKKQKGRGNSMSKRVWVHNEETQECAVVDCLNKIPYGWKRGRVLDWGLYKKKKEKRIKAEKKKNLLIEGVPCENCLNTFKTTNLKKRFCSPSCCNQYNYKNDKKETLLIKGDEKKFVKKTSVSSYLKYGWTKG